MLIGALPAVLCVEFGASGRPVVITDYINEGRLSTKGEVFDEEYWKRKCGGHVYRVQRAAGSAGWGGLSKHSDQTLNRSFDVFWLGGLD